MFETERPRAPKNAFLKVPCSQPSPLSPVTGASHKPLLQREENQNRKEVRKFKRQDSSFLFILYVSHSSLQTAMRQQMLHTLLLPRCCSQEGCQSKWFSTEFFTVSARSLHSKWKKSQGFFLALKMLYFGWSPLLQHSTGKGKAKHRHGKHHHCLTK